MHRAKTREPSWLLPRLYPNGRCRPTGMESWDIMLRAKYQRELEYCYLFTSNMSPSDLDPAMRRPGRIDVIMEFAKPDALLRCRLIRERWHVDILAEIEVERVVVDTDGFNFAEMEEARKLLVMHHLDTGRWDWSWVLSAMRHSQHARQRGGPIGFHHATGCVERFSTQPA